MRHAAVCRCHRHRLGGRAPPGSHGSHRPAAQMGSDAGSQDEALALAFEAGLPYAGLRGHVHDAGLDRLVPPEVARRLRVVPLAVRGDTLYLASPVADPDVEALEPTLAGRRVALAIAASDEV